MELSDRVQLYAANVRVAEDMIKIVMSNVRVAVKDASRTDCYFTAMRLLGATAKAYNVLLAPGNSPDLNISRSYLMEQLRKFENALSKSFPDKSKLEELEKMAMQIIQLERLYWGKMAGLKVANDDFVMETTP